MRFLLKLLFLCIFILPLILVYAPKLFWHPQIPTPISQFISQPTATPADLPVTVGFVGDLGLGRHITSTARVKDDFTWSFQGISPWLIQNDFTVANLESPIIKDCPPGPTGTFTFCGDEQFLPSLVKNKFVLSLANNHIFNYGESGFSQTKSYLSANHIDYYYSHRPDSEFSQKTVNGIHFGFLGYDFITNPRLDPQVILQKVKLYKPQVDWLVVSLHWGNEYLPEPEAWRIQLAHQMIDAGADVIHGHHPHVWQGVETYRDKLIFYSFGNFIFDQSWSAATSHSQIARITFTKKTLSYVLSPIVIKFNSQPWLMP